MKSELIGVFTLVQKTKPRINYSVSHGYEVHSLFLSPRHKSEASFILPVPRGEAPHLTEFGCEWNTPREMQKGRVVGDS